MNPDRQYPQGRLMVFCKAPEAGKVMTRLAHSLDEIGLDGANIAAKIHEYLAIERLRNVTREFLSPIELWCAPDLNHPFFKYCEKEFPVILKEQGQGDLGERMSRAFDDAFLASSYAILIGTDCPGMDLLPIRKAFQLLSEKKCSVIGPAEDGGYVLIGLSRPQPAIFQNMNWGSPQVCNETRKYLVGQVEELDCLWDVDRLEDLWRLKHESRKLGLGEEFIRYLDSIDISDMGESSGMIKITGADSLR